MFIEVLRSLKFPAVLGVVVGTVWVAAWENELTTRVERGYVLPAPKTPQPALEVISRQSAGIARPTGDATGHGRDGSAALDR